MAPKNALRSRERQRATLHAELESLRRLRAAAPVDGRVLEQKVGAVVADWKGLMGRQVSEARRLLKGFLEGRVMFTAGADSLEVEFVGGVRMGPLLHERREDRYGALRRGPGDRLHQAQLDTLLASPARA